MKLYYKAGACSFAPHVALREVGASFDLAAVDLQKKKLEDGSDYLEINPRGYVPALVRDDGMKLFEVAAILQFIADQHPEANLAPAAGADERYELQGWLSFVGAELHKTLPQLFMPNIPEEMRPVARARLAVRLGFLETALEGKQWLMGDTYTVADIYCATVLNWTKRTDYDLGQHPNISAMLDRFNQRSAVADARKAEE